MNILSKTTAAVLAATALTAIGAGVASAAPAADVQGDVYVSVYDNATGASGDFRADAEIVEGWTFNIEEVPNGNYIWVHRDPNGQKYAGPHFGLAAGQGPRQNAKYDVTVTWNGKTLLNGTMQAGTSKVTNF